MQCLHYCLHTTGMQYKSKAAHLARSAYPAAPWSLRTPSLDEEVRLQVEVEARGAQQHSLHVVRAEPEVSQFLAGREQLAQQVLVRVRVGVRIRVRVRVRVRVGVGVRVRVRVSRSKTRSKSASAA